MSSDSGARSVNGVRLHSEGRGRGTPILCVHGAGSSALAWARGRRRRLTGEPPRPRR